jgi:hypothetical protein
LLPPIGACLGLKQLNVSGKWHSWFLYFQEGKIRAKLAKILKGRDGVRFENSFATGDGIKIVRNLSHSNSVLKWICSTTYYCL